MDLFLEALAVTTEDLLGGLLLVIAVGTVAWLIRQEVNEAAQERDAELEALPEIEYEDIWAGLTPDLDARRAEARFGPDREAA